MPAPVFLPVSYHPSHQLQHALCGFASQSDSLLITSCLGADGTDSPQQAPACVLAGLAVGQELACHTHADCTSRSAAQKWSHYFRQGPGSCYHNSELDVQALSVCRSYFSMILWLKNATQWGKNKSKGVQPQGSVSSILSTVSR